MVLGKKYHSKHAVTGEQQFTITVWLRTNFNVLPKVRANLSISSVGASKL